MLGSAFNQLRYVADVLRGRTDPRVLTRISRDLVATLAEFGAPGEDSALLPGGRGVAVDPEVRRTVANRALRATARAADETAYYRQLFESCGLRSAELSLSTWTRLPVTPKRALRAMPAAFVSARANPVLLAATTGTSGSPTSVWFCADEIETATALSTIALAVADGLRPHHVLASAVSSRAVLPGLVVGECVRRIGAGLVHLGTIEPSLALERLAAPLNLPGKAPQITMLNCAASYLAALVAAAERDGWSPDDFGLEVITVGGEVLTGALRQRAQQALGARVRSTYLMTEIVPVGGAYCSQGHLHYPAEFGHVELLDPLTSQPAAPGQLAMLVVTPYAQYRQCTILLRYGTGDLVRVLDTEPTCELAGIPASGDIVGRYSGPLSLAVPTRSVLELLEAEREIPLPVRYSLVGDPADPDDPSKAMLHVAVNRASPALLGRLEDGATRAGLPIGGIVLHEDAATLPSPTPLRVDLREHTFELAGRAGRAKRAPRATGTTEVTDMAGVAGVADAAEVTDVGDAADVAEAARA